MNKTKEDSFSDLLAVFGIVVFIIFIAFIILSNLPTIDDVCLNEPNKTLYTSDGAVISCLDHLNEVYFDDNISITK